MNGFARRLVLTERQNPIRTALLNTFDTGIKLFIVTAQA